MEDSSVWIRSPKEIRRFFKILRIAFKFQNCFITMASLYRIVENDISPHALTK